MEWNAIEMMAKDYFTIDDPKSAFFFFKTILLDISSVMRGGSHVAAK